MNETSLPSPGDFLRASWRMFRTAPGVFLVRLLYDGFALGLRTLTVLFVLGFIAVNIMSLAEAGYPLGALPAGVVAVLTEPSVFLGLTGMLFTAWVMLFAAEALAAAGLWGALGQVARGGTVSPFGTAFRNAVDRFADAVAVRVFTTAATMTLMTVLLGSLVVIAAATSRLAGVTTSLVGPSLVAAVLLTVVASCVAICRLTAEFVAAAVFVDGKSMGDAMVDAAQAVLEHPIFVYRLFVHAAGVLVPPLLLDYFAIMIQNIALQADVFVGEAAVFRLAADGILFIGFAAFFVAMQSMFFAYFAWWRGVLDPALMSKSEDAQKVPGLIDLIPQDYPNVVSVDEVLGTWLPEELVVVEDAIPVAKGAYDLAGILRPDEEE